MGLSRNYAGMAVAWGSAGSCVCWRNYQKFIFDSNRSSYFVIWQHRCCIAMATVLLLSSFVAMVTWWCNMMYYTDYEAVVKLSEDFNGADLRNVCTEAGMSLVPGFLACALPHSSSHPHSHTLPLTPPHTHPLTLRLTGLTLTLIWSPHSHHTLTFSHSYLILTPPHTNTSQSYPLTLTQSHTH